MQVPTTKALLDEAARVLGSDAAVARYLHVSRQYISGVRHGRHHFSDYQAARLFDAIDQPHENFLALKAEHAPNAQEGRYWLGKWKSVAAVLLLAVAGTIAGPSNVRAASGDSLAGIYNAHTSRRTRTRRALKDRQRPQQAREHHQQRFQAVGPPRPARRQVAAHKVPRAQEGR